MVRIPQVSVAIAVGCVAVLAAGVSATAVSGSPKASDSQTAVVSTLASTAQTTAEPAVTLDMVAVSDPGNPADTATGYGAVAEEFSIATTEVTIAQYVAFLNAVAAVPANEAIRQLFKEEMADPGEDPGTLIERAGAGTETDPYVYTAAASAFWPDAAAAQRPVAWVTWFDAARFTNWLHNGATLGSDTESGAYTLKDFQESGYVPRNVDARFWIPSEDEWYKAAYYDPSRTGGSQYWEYPTMSDRPPRFAQVAQNAPAPAANFQNVSKGSEAGVLAPAGSYPTSASYYGTLDQGGQLWEWTEAGYPDPERGPNRIVRGGSWGPGITPLRKTVRRDYGPMASEAFYFDDDTGFRVAGLVAPR